MTTLVQFRQILVAFVTIGAANLVSQVMGSNVHVDCRASWGWVGVENGEYYCDDSVGQDCCSGYYGDWSEPPACKEGKEPEIVEGRRCHWGQGYCYSCKDNDGEAVWFFLLIGLGFAATVMFILVFMCAAACKSSHPPTQTITMMQPGMLPGQMPGGQMMQLPGAMPAGGTQMVFMPPQQPMAMPGQQMMQMPGQQQVMMVPGQQTAVVMPAP